MPTEMDLAIGLADAIANDRADVDSTPYRELDLDGAKRVQALVQKLRRENPYVIKTALPNGVVMGASIFRPTVTEGRSASVSSALLEGVEVEVAAVLGRDIDVGMGEAAVRDAIDRYVVGIELIGSRFTERVGAGLMAELADNLSTAGYVTDTSRAWEHGPELAGADVEVRHDGKVIYAAPAKPIFGHVLTSLIAYAREPFPSLPLKAGMIVTTGTLCGLVAVPGPGHVSARLAHHSYDLASG